MMKKNKEEQKKRSKRNQMKKGNNKSKKIKIMLNYLKRLQKSKKMFLVYFIYKKNLLIK